MRILISGIVLLAIRYLQLVLIITGYTDLAADYLTWEGGLRTEISIKIQ